MATSRVASSSAHSPRRHMSLASLPSSIVTTGRSSSPPRTRPDSLRRAVESGPNRFHRGPPRALIARGFRGTALEVVQPLRPDDPAATRDVTREEEVLARVDVDAPTEPTQEPLS